MLMLVVDDDEDYAEIISQTLRRDSHDVVVASSAAGAVRFAGQKPPDMAVLDVMLPDGSGFDLCRRLREGQPSLPVIFLSSLDRAADVVAGLNGGGDDYLTKPFHPSELLARVRALGRRSAGVTVVERPQPSRISAHGLELDTGNQSAYLDGINLHCTRLEFEVLEQLVKYPGQVLSHAFLSEQIWGYKNVHDATLLKGHVSSLRAKVKKSGGDEEMIHTVHGVGYSYTPV
ncbi:MAG: response regulator transcription factor [Dehalococcoidia bacterium]